MERTLTITTRKDWKAALRDAGAAAAKGIEQGTYQGETLNFETPGAFFYRLTERRRAMLAELQGARTWACLRLRAAPEAGSETRA